MQALGKVDGENISFKQVAINIPGEYVTSPLLLKVLTQKYLYPVFLKWQKPVPNMLFLDFLPVILE